MLADRLLPHPMHVRSSSPSERDCTVAVETVELSLPELALFPFISRIEMLNVRSPLSGSWSSSCTPQIPNPDSSLPCTPATHTPFSFLLLDSGLGPLPRPLGSPASHRLSSPGIFGNY